jgi:hypothetical protein
VDKNTGLRCDQTIALTSVNASHDYPQHLRRIKFYDAEHKKYLIFLTNNFDLPALTIAQLYRCRWQVELFCKWGSPQNSEFKAREGFRFEHWRGFARWWTAGASQNPQRRPHHFESGF